MSHDTCEHGSDIRGKCKECDARYLVQPGYASGPSLNADQRERHRAEESAVVEAALRYDALRHQFEHHYLTRTDGGPTAGDLSDADECIRKACADLRAKRGG